VDSDPVLRFARGTVKIVNMDVAGALEDLRAAAEGAEAVGLLDVADAARVRLGLTAMFHGDFEASVAENRIVHTRRAPHDALGVLAAANLEMGLCYLGRNAEAGEITARIDASPIDFPDRLPVLGARCYEARLRGDASAQRALGLQGATAARKHQAPGGLCFLLLHVSEGTLRVGGAEEALEVAEEATAICHSMREHWWEIVARQSRLLALVELGRIGEARREGREIVAACDAYGGLLWTRSEAALVLAELPGEDPDAALKIARESADRTTHPALRAELRIALARRALEKGVPADAHRLLDEATAELGSVAAREVLQAIALLRARIQLAEGRSPRARETLAGRLHAGVALRREAQALLPVLVPLALDGDDVARAAVVGLGTHALSHVARRRGRRSLALREEILEARARPLDVRSLGDFGVVRRGDHDEPDVTIGFRTPRVAQLFRWLVARTERGMATPTDVLIDRLWPDQDTEAARKSLHTHLSWLRRALEPDLPHRAASRYIKRDEGGYRLDLRGGSWDAARFRRLAGSGLVARRIGDTIRAEALLGEALPHYTGALFAENPADDILADERTELAALFAEASLAGARLALELSKPEIARERLERLVAVDGSIESAWIGLMQAAAARGRPEEIPRVLERCREALQREIDSEPSPETEALAESLGPGR
jgi:DNA-binding SARP family transcriptional activator